MSDRLLKSGLIVMLLALSLTQALSETIDAVAAKKLTVVFENDYIRAFTIEIKPSETLLADDNGQRLMVSLSPMVLQPVIAQARKPIRLGAGKTLWLESKQSSSAKNISAIPVRYLVIQAKARIIDGEVASCRQRTLTLVDKSNTRVCQLNALEAPENIINRRQLAINHYQRNNQHEVRIWLDNKIWLLWHFITTD